LQATYRAPTTAEAAAAVLRAAATAAEAEAEESEACGGTKRKRDEDNAAAAAAAAAAASRPYLCTGWDCFVVSEPCTMCAMALVHARVRRVVYARPDAAAGALESRGRLQAVRSLNHHYAVYCLDGSA
jgi:tRNA-specific adenosine deaminase 3